MLLFRGREADGRHNEIFHLPLPSGIRVRNTERDQLGNKSSVRIEELGD